METGGRCRGAREGQQSWPAGASQPTRIGRDASVSAPRTWPRARGPPCSCRASWAAEPAGCTARAGAARAARRARPGATGSSRRLPPAARGSPRVPGTHRSAAQRPAHAHTLCRRDRLRPDICQLRKVSSGKTCAGPCWTPGFGGAVGPCCTGAAHGALRRGAHHRLAAGAVAAKRVGQGRVGSRQHKVLVDVDHEQAQAGAPGLQDGVAVHQRLPAAHVRRARALAMVVPQHQLQPARALVRLQCLVRQEVGHEGALRPAPRVTSFPSARRGGGAWR